MGVVTRNGVCILYNYVTRVAKPDLSDLSHSCGGGVAIEMKRIFRHAESSQCLHRGLTGWPKFCFGFLHYFF